MPMYVFNGVASPERAWAELNQPLSFEIKHPDANIEGTLIVHMYKNQVTCRFDSLNIIDDLVTTKNIVADFVQCICDSACLDSTAATTIDIRTCCNVEDGAVVVFGVNIPEIGIQNTEFRNIDIGKILKISAENRYFRRALGDFRQSIISAEDTGFLCYRAIESLLNFIRATEDVNDKKKAIGVIEKRLNLHSDCIVWLRKLGGDVRHGHPVWVSGPDRVIAIKLTREILRRFAAFSDGTAMFSELKPV